MSDELIADEIAYYRARAGEYLRAFGRNIQLRAAGRRFYWGQTTP